MKSLAEKVNVKSKIELVSSMDQSFIPMKMVPTVMILVAEEESGMVPE